MSRADLEGWIERNSRLALSNCRAGRATEANIYTQAAVAGARELLARDPRAVETRAPLVKPQLPTSGRHEDIEI